MALSHPAFDESQAPGAKKMRLGLIVRSLFVSTPKTQIYCPHCNSLLKAFLMPDGAGWETDKPQWACFNNNCPYYKGGWEWMKKQYNATASYRYRVLDPKNPKTKPKPLLVQTEDAATHLIIDDENL
jgi:hypothetical protein